MFMSSPPVCLGNPPPSVKEWIDGHYKPYDAEVEYLESNGTQYIDTGIVMANRIIKA